MHKQRHWLIRRFAEIGRRPRPTSPRRSLRSPCDPPVLLLLLMVGLSLIVSPLPRHSLGAVWPLLVGVALCWVIARWPWTERQLGWAWWGMILLGTALALVGLLGMLAKPRVFFPWMQRWLLALRARLENVQQRLPDTFHPNVIAAALEMFIPFGIGSVLHWSQDEHQRRWARALLAGVLTLTMLVILVLTQSRAAYIGLTAALLVFVVLTRPRWLLVAVPILIGMVVGGGVLVGWSKMADALVSSDPAFGLEWRLEVWSVAICMVRDFMFTGVGFGCFEPVAVLLYPQPTGSAPAHAHNLFLQVAVDLGLPGLIAFLAILGLATCLAVRSYATAVRAGWARWSLLLAACLASLVGMCVHGVFDAASWGNKGAFVPWVVIGLAVALDRWSQGASS